MIDTQTKLTAILGYPVSHSYSPIMHNAAFRKLGLNCEYLPIECAPDALRDISAGIRRMNFAGFNVTQPLKTEIIQYLDGLDESARIVGAVNTVKKCGDSLIGYNTDGGGFIDALTEEGIPIKGKRFSIIGAGGAARAVAAALVQSGAAEVRIAARRADAAYELARHIPGAVGCVLDASALYGFDCVINASGVGMSPSIGASPVDKLWLRDNTYACELAYNPARTQFLADAEENGAAVINGLGMFINQGVRAFEIWFGITAPKTEMRAAVEGLRS